MSVLVAHLQGDRIKHNVAVAATVIGSACCSRRKRGGGKQCAQSSAELRVVKQQLVDGGLGGCQVGLQQHVSGLKRGHSLLQHGHLCLR